MKFKPQLTINEMRDKLRLIAAKEAKEKGIGRNDPCVCGSGMKYKRCCK